jgi:RNA polymerase sigma-70 factor (ECF subfamily)
MNGPSGGDSLQRALADGQPAAFAALYDRLAPSLLRAARTILGSPANNDAEDVVHDVFVSLAKSRQKLASIRDFDAYVFTILRHTAIRRLLRRQNERKKLRDWAVSRSAEEQSGYAADDDLSLVLASLPTEQREVIALEMYRTYAFGYLVEFLAISDNSAARSNA